MTIEELYNHYDKNWSKMSRHLYIGANTYQRWRKLGYIPITTQMEIEKRTEGLFKANLLHATKQFIPKTMPGKVEGEEAC